MLEMGVLPDVAAATSATMILFTSASAAVVFLSFGGVPPAYAGLAFAIGLLSTAAGQVRIRHGVLFWIMDLPCWEAAVTACINHGVGVLCELWRKLRAEPLCDCLEPQTNNQFTQL